MVGGKIEVETELERISEEGKAAEKNASRAELSKTTFWGLRAPTARARFVPESPAAKRSYEKLQPASQDLPDQHVAILPDHRRLSYILLKDGKHTRSITQHDLVP